MDDRYHLPLSTPLPPHRDEATSPTDSTRARAILYVRGKGDELDALAARMRKFAKYGQLDIAEEFIEEGRLSEAWAAAFRHLTMDAAHECGLLIPYLDTLGHTRREVRGRMAALRELNITVYEAESGAKITWVPLQVEGG